MLRRSVGALLVLTAVSMLIFSATMLLPGDAARAYLGTRASSEQIEVLRAQMGLDRPAPVQYADWVTGMLRGDLGDSLIARRPVAEMLGRPLKNSLVLGGITVLVLIPLSIVLGVGSGIRAGTKLDAGIGLMTTLFYAVPMFITGMMLILFFALRLGWFPAVALLPANGSLLDAWDVLVLPVTALVLGSSAYLVRLTRAGTIEVMRSDWVEATILRGVSRRRLIGRHVLPAVLPPVFQVIVLYAASMVSGIVVIETVFGYPGAGQELVRAVGSRDIPVVQAIAMIGATFSVLGNVLADLVMISSNPRLRAEVWS